MIIPNLPRKRMEENERRKREEEVERIAKENLRESTTKPANFKEDNKESDEISYLPIWIDKYKEHFPDYIHSTYMYGDSTYQRKGVDRIVYLNRGREILIDEKFDRWDNDRMFLEIWSDKDRGKKGWLVDSSKTCDYLAYLKIPNKTPREVWMIPFFELQGMWIRHKEYLLNGYDLKPVPNEDGKWCSEGIAVPIAEVFKLIYS